MTAGIGTFAIDRAGLKTTRSCSDNEEFRYWNVYSFDPLDVRDPDQLVLGDRVEMDMKDEGQSIYANGKALYYNFQRPLAANNDPRAMVKRFFKSIDFADPQHATASAAINVPGDVIAADGDTVYTRDWIWQDTDARTLVARLTLKDELAYLQASRMFEDRSVSAVKLDGAGHMLVSSDPAYSGVTSLSPNRVNGFAKKVPSSGPKDIDQPQSTQMRPTMPIAM